VIVNRTFDQKRSLCPGSAVTGECREISRQVGSDNLSLDIEGTMKIHHLLVIVGMAIGFALPAFAQQKDTVDPQVSEQLSALSKKTDEAFNSGDATALGALYTEDAVLVNDTGPIYGREAIEKHWADVFKQVQFSNHLDKRDQNFTHIIGTAGIEAWSNGEWSTTLKGEKFGPVDAKGNWVEIYRREGDTWRKRLDMWNVTPAPPATAATTPSATPTPSNK
jgi:ketosteroid isomerase-like protein